MGCDHLDVLTLGQVRIQTVTVVGFVADQSRREGVEEAVSEEAVDELAFVRRSAFDTNGETKAVIPGESDDFSSLATFGGPDRSTTIYETSSIYRLWAWFCSPGHSLRAEAGSILDALTVAVVPRSLCVGGWSRLRCDEGGFGHSYISGVALRSAKPIRTRSWRGFP